MKLTQDKLIFNSNFFTKLGVFSSCAMVAALSVYIYSPVAETHAETSAGGSTVITTNVSSIIAMNTSTEELVLDAMPNSFTHGSVNVNVSTNSQYGYTLALEDEDSNSNMASTVEGVSDAFTSNFTSGRTEDTMEANTWGYSTNATNYFKIPTVGSPVGLRRTNTPMTEAQETTAVDFGVKVGMITAGSYKDTVRFTAYVNGNDGAPAAVEAGDSALVGNPKDGSMQDFSCSSLAHIGDSIVLTDARDNNEYLIKKLADGRCWMTQNLRLANVTLTSVDTNLPDGETWTLPASDITGFKAKNTNNVYIDPSYGGYYTFYTATAGWGTDTVSSGNSPKDICPKGWHIPSGSSDGIRPIYQNYRSSAMMRGVPGFVLSGYIYYGQAYDQGTSGNYWLSTVSDANTSYAYELLITENTVNPTNKVKKESGDAVRCMIE